MEKANNSNDNKRYFSENKSNVLSTLKSRKIKSPDTNDPTVAAYINEQIQGGLKAALKGKTPRVNTTDATEQEQAKFKKMTYKERLNLFNSNPQAYNKLSKGEKK